VLKLVQSSAAGKLTAPNKLRVERAHERPPSGLSPLRQVLEAARSGGAQAGGVAPAAAAAATRVPLGLTALEHIGRDGNIEGCAENLGIKPAARGFELAAR